MENWLIVNKHLTNNGFWIKVTPKLYKDDVLFNPNTRIFELPNDLIHVTNDPENTDMPQLYNFITGEVFVLQILDEGDVTYRLSKLYSTFIEV